MGCTRQHVGEEAHIVGVVGYHQEIQRPPQSRLEAGGGGDFLATGESIGGFETQPVATGGSIRGGIRMQVGITPEHPGGGRQTRIGRELLADGQRRGQSEHQQQGIYSAGDAA